MTGNPIEGARRAEVAGLLQRSLRASYGLGMAIGFEIWAGAGDPPVPRDPDKETKRDEGVATKTRPKADRPPKFKVILYNDDYTPMEFVVSILEKVFSKSPAAATQIMLQIHRGGMGVAGVFTLEIAETKAATVLRMAEERGYPLLAGVEKE